jgi:hypothetical protein
MLMWDLIVHNAFIFGPRNFLKALLITNMCGILISPDMVADGPDLHLSEATGKSRD